MTWITANKGAGPWAFTEQPPKQGYVNNPRWTSTPDSDIIHEPCGYWMKGLTTTVIPVGNVYVVGWTPYGDKNPVATYEFFTVAAKQADGSAAPFFKRIWGQYHAMAALDLEDRVWFCGQDNGGRFGMGTSDTTLYDWWFQHPAFPRGSVKQVHFGHNQQTYVVKTDGTLWVAGTNSWGLLGLPSPPTFVTTFTQIGTDSDWEEVTAGITHVLARKANGALWGWGTGAAVSGEDALGLSSSGTFTGTPIPLTPTSVVGISAAHYSSMVVTASGEVLVTGRNEKGIFGRGDTSSLWSWSSILTPYGTAKQVKLAYGFAFLIASNGSLWSCGHNSTGRLGLGIADTSYETHVFQQIGNEYDWYHVETPYSAGFAMKPDGRVYAWGFNSYSGVPGDPSQCGLGGGTIYTTAPTPVPVNGDKWILPIGGVSYTTSPVPVYGLRREAFVKVLKSGLKPIQPIWTPPA